MTTSEYGCANFQTNGATDASLVLNVMHILSVYAQDVMSQPGHCKQLGNSFVLSVVKLETVKNLSAMSWALSPFQASNSHVFYLIHSTATTTERLTTIPPPGCNEKEEGSAKDFH